MTTAFCIRQLWTASRGFRLRIALSGVAGVAHVCVSLLFIAASKRLVDMATGHDGGSLAPSIVLMAACMLMQLLLPAVESRLNSLNAVTMRNRLRHTLFVRLMNSRPDGKEQFHTGDMLNRMEGDTATMTDTLCTALPDTFATLFRLAAAFGFLLLLDARLAWTLLLIMPVALAASKGYLKRMRRLTREIRALDSRMQTHVQEHLQHRVLLRSMERVGRSADLLAGWQTELKRQTLRRTDFSLFSRTVVQLGFAAGYVTAFLWGVFGLRSGAVTFGMMTAFLQLVAQVQRPVVELSRQVPAFARTLTSVERLEEIASLPQEEQGKAIALDGNVGLRMERVDFTYPGGGRKVMDGFTHDFRPGTVTAIVGETGAGKSTLIRLILALLAPDKGKITLYNKVKAENVSPLTRCNLVYVPQGNTLMSGTIRDNLLLGNPDATEGGMEEALHTAAAEFVFSLPDGPDTLCGEQGTGLSEGQAQRIAIARGLLRPGTVLLLDEPTSSLDGETERILMQRLTSRLMGRTLIVVTHKEAVAQWCGEVVRIKRTEGNENKEQ